MKQQVEVLMENLLPFRADLASTHASDTRIRATVADFIDTAVQQIDLHFRFS
jgi:hypothetical protein